MRRVLAYASAALVMAGAAIVAVAPAASADPSANDWAAVRKCESSGDYSINTGNGYYGAYQFDLGTWQSVGGSGVPSDASPAEQDYRALYLYRMRGWDPWICASLAGLDDSKDPMARSGKVPTRAESAYMAGGASNYTPPNADACNVGGNTAPPWGGVDFVYGKTYRDMTCWQRQMGHLGYGLQGSGHFGSNTLAALHDFEKAKGLPQGDVVNQRVWVAAWGKSGGVKAGVTTSVPTTSKPTTTKPTTSAPKPTTSAPKPTTSAPATTSKPKPTTPAYADLYPGVTAKSCKVGASKAPAWPGDSWTMGAYDKNLACWQMQMGYRGYDLHGSGYYGENTLTAAKDIQNRNKLGGSGLIGPKTWKAAWEGKAKA